MLIVIPQQEEFIFTHLSDGLSKGRVIRPVQTNYGVSICGENFSIADITGHSIFVTCERLKFEISENFQNVLKWKSTLEKRECFKNE